MLKRINILLFLLMPMTMDLHSQNFANSPYSRYGLGDIIINGFGQNRAMGGLSVPLRSRNHVNYLNPASYTSQDTLSFIFDVGFRSVFINQKTSEESRETNNVNLDHLAISFPFTKWLYGSAGLVPFSKMGYNIRNEESIHNVGDVDFLYNGSGELNRLYFGTGVNIRDHLFLGVNMSYIFGSFEHLRQVSFPADYVAADYFENEFSSIKGIYFNYGLQYSFSIKDLNTFTVGFVFDNKSSLNTSQEISKLSQYPTGISDTANYSETSGRSKIIPRKMGVGFSYTRSNKFLFGMEYETNKWSSSEFAGKLDNMGDQESYRAGFEITPNPESFRDYWKKIHYRFGGYYTNSYLDLDNQDIIDYGVSLGFGLPFKNSGTSFNFAVEYGKRSPLENIMITENYVKISLNITLYDFWFYKPKFD